MEVTLKICRFDPGEDISPYFQEFPVSVEGSQTVLDSLLLAWQQDPTFSFRRSCRSAICGSCAVRINGQPALACQTLISKATEDGGAITIEPLPYFRQLKDLVVRLEPFFASLRATIPWLILREDYEGWMSPEIARQLESPATCILCGLCQAALGETTRNQTCYPGEGAQAVPGPTRRSGHAPNPADAGAGRGVAALPPASSGEVSERDQDNSGSLVSGPAGQGRREYESLRRVRCLCLPEWQD